VFLSIIVAACWFSWGGDIDHEETIQILSWALLVATVWYLVSWRLAAKELFDVYPLFLCSATVFNGGQAILQVLGLNPIGILDGKFSNYLVAQALALVLISLMFMHAGALIGLSRSGRARSQTTWCEQSRREVRQVGLALVVFSAIPAALTIATDLSAVTTAGYFTLYQQEKATGIAGASRVIASLLPGALLFLLAGATGTRLSRRIPAFMIAAYAAAYMFMGFRGTAFVITAAALWLWDRAVKPIPRSLLAGALVAATALLPVVGLVRNLSDENRFAQDTLQTAWKSVDSPLAATVSEMGGSLLTVVYTVDLVPSRWPYEYGSTYLYAALTIVPNFFWDIHPSVAHSSSARLIWEVSPATAQKGGGIGFSYISEAFLNFGWLGTPVAVFLLGYGFGRLTTWLKDRHDPARLATAAAALIPLLMYARSESGNIVRPVIWCAILPYLVVAILRRLARRERI
jgi:oligosaccharide repeat unit polymerase